jgi:HK97 family phage prohead protease
MSETRQSQTIQLRGVNRDARTVELVASDFSLDSYGTRIDPAGWDVEQFKKNGPICVQHDSYTKDGLPVAQAIAETIRNDNGKLVMTAQFAPKGADECADRVFELVASGILRGISVGFDPIESEEVEEMVDGYKKTVRIYRKQRLLEVSFVTIPSNDNGLVVRSRAMNADLPTMKAETEALEERLKERQTEDEARAAIEGFKASHILKCVRYFENKQEANRASTKFLVLFHKKMMKEDQNENEAKAWERMTEFVDAIEEKEVETIEEKTIETEKQVEVTGTTTDGDTSVVETKEETPAAEAAPTESSTPPVPEAPEPERKASVQIPFDVLADFPAKLEKSFTDVGVEALRRGIPLKDAMKLIDGMQSAVSNSFTPHS